MLRLFSLQLLEEYSVSDDLLQVRGVLKKVCAQKGIRVKMGYDLLHFQLEASLFD